jgi:hypothetical protein
MRITAEENDVGVRLAKDSGVCAHDNKAACNSSLKKMCARFSFNCKVRSGGKRKVVSSQSDQSVGRQNSREMCKGADTFNNQVAASGTYES